MTAAIVLILSIPVAHASHEWVACLLVEWEATTSRRLGVLRRMGRAA